MGSLGLAVFMGQTWSSMAYTTERDSKGQGAGLHRWRGGGVGSAAASPSGFLC